MADRPSAHVAPYHRKRNGAVRDKVVIQARQIGATAVDKLQGSLDIDAEAIAALNGAEDLLALLLQELALSRQVFEDGSGLGDRGSRGNVVDGGARSQLRACGGAQKGLVCGAESHGAARGM